MNRRDALAAFLALATSVGSHAQAPRRVGVIHSRGASFNRDQWGGGALIAALKNLGYDEGRNLALDFRYWQKSDEIPGLLQEMLMQKPDVILAAAPPTISAAKQITDRVPVVFMFSAEPIATGVVSSLNRPGGNLTGFAWDHGFETYAKQLQLLKEALPKLRRVALLWDANPDSTHDVYEKYYIEGAKRIGLQLISIGVRGEAEIEPAFERFKREGAEALIVPPSAQVTLPHRHQIMALATRNRWPTLVGILTFDFPGALIRHAPNHSDYPRRAAVYIDRILKGTKAGDLPVEQPTRYDVVIDLKAARALGIRVPQPVLLRADKVIE